MRHDGCGGRAGRGRAADRHRGRVAMAGVRRIVLITNPMLEAWR
jgi:hypothetical protein